jgi:hypothetical protein
MMRVASLPPSSSLDLHIEQPKPVPMESPRGDIISFSVIEVDEPQAPGEARDPFKRINLKANIWLTVPEGRPRRLAGQFQFRAIHAQAKPKDLRVTGQFLDFIYHDFVPAGIADGLK